MGKLLICVFLLLSSLIFGQVSISTELGYNYRPYNLLGLNSEEKHNKPEFFLSLVGEVPFSKKIFLQMMMGYVFRKDQQIRKDRNFNPTWIGSDFINRELNVNLDLVYSLNRCIKLGGGFGLIHKLDSYVVVRYTNQAIEYQIDNKIVPAINALATYRFRRFEISFRYFYIFNIELANPFIRMQEANHGFAFGLRYKLFGRV